MSEDSLRERELSASDSQAAFIPVSAPKYEADATAYEVDEANDPYRKFTESIQAGSTIQLSLACRDGRRELLELSRTESQSWIRSTLRERMEFANEKIKERRATLAITTAQKLRGKRAIESADLAPDEESALREFNLVEEQLVPIDEGGYRQGLRLRENLVNAATSRIREDGFWDGGFDGASGFQYDAPTQREYLPRGGPMGQQQLISDVWDAQAKCYYAWTHDPLIHAAIELISDFVLGRTFNIIANEGPVQTVVDEFVNRELLPQSQQSITPWGPGRITNRLHDMATSIWRDGELFLRKFPLGDGRTKIRSLPAETIWEIVTDSEDPLEVFWYVQRYQSRVVLFAPSNLVQAQTRWVERTILRDDMLHTLINAKESDARGKSDIFPALGWAKRLRDHFDADIQKSYAQSAYQWWYKVNGGAPDLQRIAQQVIPSARPQPGSFILTNDQVDVQSVSSTVRAAVSGEGTAYDALVNHIALAFMLNKSYFGADSHANRATALVATEPTAKHLETRQDLMIALLTKLVGDVITQAAQYGLIGKDETGDEVDLGFKCVLPSIIKADAGARGTMIRQAEAMGYVSKQTAAEAFMAEAEVDDYDFDTEQEKIQVETGQDARKLIMKDVEMISKGAPTADQPAWAPGDVPNLGYTGGGNGPTNGQPAAPSTNGHSNGATTPAKPVQDPHDASPTSATGAAAIRKELGPGSPGDRSTIESDEGFREEAKRRGAVVIYP